MTPLNLEALLQEALENQTHILELEKFLGFFGQVKQSSRHHLVSLHRFDKGDASFKKRVHDALALYAALNHQEQILTPITELSLGE